MHVSDNIDRVYKELTKTGNGVGGTARLDKDKGEDIPPFECGINFSTIPPKKRYREMTQLSGGEKTLAALALLLTINSYKPSPFFVFDEVCSPRLPRTVACATRMRFWACLSTLYSMHAVGLVE